MFTPEAIEALQAAVAVNVENNRSRGRGYSGGRGRGFSSRGRGWQQSGQQGYSWNNNPSSGSVPNMAHKIQRRLATG